MGWRSGGTDGGSAPVAARRGESGAREDVCITGGCLASVLCVMVLVAGCGGATSGRPTAPTSTSDAAGPAASVVASSTEAVLPSTTQVPAASDAIAEVPPSPTADRWLPVPSQASISSVQFEDIVWTGRRFVAVGLHEFLESVDGLEWHLRGNTRAEAYLTGLAAGPRGIVAVGAMNERPASWFSNDGLTWAPGGQGLASAETGSRTAALSVGDTGDHTVAVTDVVSAREGWLAVGREDPPCYLNCGLDPVRALAWTSADGIHWKRVADQAALADGGMDAVTAGGPGFVAAGSAAGHAAIWTSVDGVRWSRVRDDPMFHPRDPALATTASGATSGHGVVVVVGNDPQQDVGAGGGVRAWWSADGRTWREAAGEAFLDGQAFHVTSTPAGFLMAGPSGAASCLGGIWASADGRDWLCAAEDPVFAGFAAYAAAASPSIEIVVGFSDVPSGDDEDETTTGAGWWRAVP